tara:strand:- start:3836 stop:4627 length:792 start_codon:yes stop_codon:yes gene_type:complete
MSKARSIQQQIEDTLWYLERPGQARGDEAKAIEILASIARGKKAGAALVDSIRRAKPTLEKPLSPWRSKAPWWSNAPWASVKGLTMVIAVGHEPGGGATGERAWNTKLAQAMKAILEGHGVTAHVYFHKLKAYGARQRALAAWIKANAPEAFLCWEIHYDAVANKTVSGHHFKYFGAKDFARLTQEEWVANYPQSRPRYDAGLHHATSGNGSGFLSAMPCWAMLAEPFFNSNAAEAAFFKPRFEEIAYVYCVAAARFAKLKNK